MSIRKFFIEYQAYKKGYSLREKSVTTYLYHLNGFAKYLLEKEVDDFRKMPENTIEEYLGQLVAKKYAWATIYVCALTIQDFFIFMKNQGYLLTNPAELLDLELYHGVDQKREIFSQLEIDQFLNAVDTQKQMMWRAFFELMYAGALRISEGVGLTITDVNLEERVLHIRNGKGGKDRYVPFSKTALVFLERYLEGERATRVKWVAFEYRQLFFLGKEGKISNRQVRLAFARILSKAGLEKNNRTVHSIRHSCATHLIEAGAGILSVSELLGHQGIETTARYTQIQQEALKRAFGEYHPREQGLFAEVDEGYRGAVEKLQSELLQRKRGS